MRDGCPTNTGDSFISWLVALHVKSKMIGAGKAALTDFALKWLGTSMLTDVSSQLVGSSKTPMTIAEVAQVRLFTSVDSLMGL